MTEQEANEVLEWIAEVSMWNPEDVVIKHLYNLHKLRDRKLHKDLQGHTIDGPGVLWPLYAMQTCYY